jgi:hypothetical protein
MKVQRGTCNCRQIHGEYKLIKSWFSGVFFLSKLDENVSERENDGEL